jgi:anti-sigma28 factor (negative regulator of flagellin synthesis)
MKIDGNILNPWLQADTVAKSPSKCVSASETSMDQELDAFPSDVAQVRALASDSATARADNVAGLQRAVASGHYRVADVEVADAMLRDWQV